MDGESRGVRRALYCAAAARGICESGLKFFQRCSRLILLKEQVAELFAGRNDRTGGHRKLFDGVLFIG